MRSNFKFSRRFVSWAIIAICTVVFVRNAIVALSVVNNMTMKDLKIRDKVGLAVSKTRPPFHVNAINLTHVRTKLAGNATDYDYYAIWPSENVYDTDRIVNQLEYNPKWLTDMKYGGVKVPLKTILVYNGLGSWGLTPGQSTFLEQKCHVNTCNLTSRRGTMSTADAVLFRNRPKHERKNVPASQIWIIYMLESPNFTYSFKPANGLINWTATYRHDSDIVTPYEKFVPYFYDFDYDNQTRQPIRNYAAGKTKQVAWFVSNCDARNKRLDYAIELSKFIQVDIYGRCGKLRCPRGSSHCPQMLNKDYKFYLAFENSNCRDYITEKFFVTGLQHDILPVVMGAAPEDYARAAPHHSYIHVDDFESPWHLARYLHELNQNDDLYNEYFQWKGTGEFINTLFWCRVCALLHDRSRGSHVYTDLERWWRGDSACIGTKSWRDIPRRPT